MSRKSNTQTVEGRIMNDFRPAPAGWQVLRFEMLSIWTSEHR